MTTALDETFRQLRRDAMLTLGEQHEAALARDIERALSLENMETLKRSMEGQASYTNRMNSESDEFISFGLLIKTIDTSAFAKLYPTATISTPHCSFSMRDFKPDYLSPPAFYCNHPSIKNAIARVKNFFGKTTEFRILSMSIIGITLWFRIPMSLPSSSS
jgi:hypothetical protein